MKKSLEEILLINSLELDLPNGLISYEDQTNKTINKTMNNFIKENGKFFSNKTFYIVSNNDLPTILTYSILKGINAIYEFTFKIVGDISRIKKYLKYDNEIENRSIGDICRLEDTILVSCFHPIYYVKKDFAAYNKTIHDCQEVNLIKNFAPKQLEIIADFYGIDMNKFKKNSQEIGNLSRLITLNSKELKDNKYISTLPKKKFLIVELEGDETDFELFDRIINTTDICVYSIKEDMVDSLKANLNPFINSYNCIRDDIYFCNINNEELMKEIMESDYEYEILFVPKNGG